MDIREEIRLSKEDKLSESSGLPHSGQQRELVNRNEYSMAIQCFEFAVGRERQKVVMSERVFNPTPITQFNPVTNEVLNDNVKLAIMTEDADIVKENPALVDKASVLSVTKTNVLTQLETAPDVENYAPDVGK
ncbi:hypothetical protein Tco_0929473, partial [Tanacetum coccineum]